MAPSIPSTSTTSRSPDHTSTTTKSSSSFSPTASSAATTRHRQITNLQLPPRPSPILVSTHEEMNPQRRSSMEDCTIYAPPGTWDAPDPTMAYLGLYDGHGGMYDVTKDSRTCSLSINKSLTFGCLLFLSPFSPFVPQLLLTIPHVRKAATWSSIWSMDFCFTLLTN